MTNKKSVFFRNIILPGIILALLASYYFFVSVPRSKADAQKGRETLLNGIPWNDLKSIELTQADSSNKSRLVLEKVSGSWNIVSPKADAANEEAVREFLKEAPLLKSEKIIENSTAESLAQFGFSDPEARIVLRMNDGLEWTVENGSKTPDGKFYYVRLGRDPARIYLVYSYKFKNIIRNPDDYRSLEIFNLPVENIRAIDFSSRKRGRYLFTNASSDSTEDLRMVLPERAKADRYRVHSFLLDIYTWSVSGFQVPEKIKRDVSENPLYRVTLVSFEGQTNEVRIGGPLSNGVYPAFLPGRRAFVTIEDGELPNKFNYSVTNFIQSERSR